MFLGTIFEVHFVEHFTAHFEVCFEVQFLWNISRKISQHFAACFEVQVLWHKLVPRDIYLKAPLASILNQFLQTRYHLKA